MSCYLIRTKPRQENKAYYNLMRQNIKSYFPVVRADQRKTSLDFEFLFPSYGFVFLTPGVDDFSTIRSTFGVAYLVAFGGSPLPVSQSIVDALRANEDENGIHEIGKVDYDRGDIIRVVDGPFTGYEGIFQTSDSFARVSILINGLQYKVQTDRRNIQPKN